MRMKWFIPMSLFRMTRSTTAGYLPQNRNRTGDMKCIRYRRARPEDSFYFSELMQLSAPLFFPTLFGEKFTAVIRKLFVRPNNLFSYENAYVAECDNEVAGIILGYNYSSKSKAELHTGGLLARHMGIEFAFRIIDFLRLLKTTGWIKKDEYYISNIAVYPRYTGSGLGRGLIARAEEDAKNIGMKRIGLDVETDNEPAMRLYEKLGYSKTKESKILLRKHLFGFYRMYKDLETPLLGG
jgi:ribosomal protein S18 acetylase RimI-like enzyme